MAEGGRGLQVVDSVAVRWGSFRLPGAQAVWCDLGQPLRAPDADAWAWLRTVCLPVAEARHAAQPGDEPACRRAGRRGTRPGRRFQAAWWPVSDERGAGRYRDGGR